jgi:cysteinyl-tRNA synthetase
MALKIYNTLTKQIETFQPINQETVTMYSCGPTVYDYVHIGNLRTFLMADFLRRTLFFLGYGVKHVKNITDVGHLTQDDIDEGEDKMIKAARREKKTPYDIARFYEVAFHQDEAELNILPADIFTRATDYVPQMITFIGKLVDKGYAYVVDGAVYFDVDKFPDYGKLSGNTLDNLKIGARLEANPDKRNPYDFALWLKAGDEHLMRWESPWGVGYPGWHIECSAMSISNLGETIDIHTGGEDNIFPHHEDEIAQSEGVTGKKFVNYWVHGRFLLVDGEKMSKSKGNFYTLSDVKQKGFTPLVYRYLCLTAHFQTQMNLTWQSLSDSQRALEKLTSFVSSVETDKAAKPNDKYFQQFQAALEDNLNTPLALAAAWEMLKDKSVANTEKKATLLRFDEVLGLELGNAVRKKIETLDLEFDGESTISIRNLTGGPVNEEALTLIKMREMARKNKDYAASDRLRDEIKQEGYAIKDTPDGIEIDTIR